MAKLDCQYFPDTPATWTCTACHTHFGEKCIPAAYSSHWHRQQPRCIRCDGVLNYLGNATGAKPFWRMLPHFLSYPLSPNCLMVVALVAGLSLMFRMNLFGLFLALFGLAVVMKYSFAIIEQRGRGDTTPPSVAEVITGDEHHLFLRQIAVLVGMGMAVSAAGRVNGALAVLVSAFITLAMPASIIVLAVEKSVRRALNPLALLTLMTTIGLPYLLLWVCTQIISAGPMYVLQWFTSVLPPAAVLPTVVAIMVYFTFVLYAMLGYVLFEYQNELGYNAASDRPEMDAEAFEKARAMGETVVLIQDGQLERARQVLRRALDVVRDDLDLHLHYHKLLMLTNDDTALGNHCDYFVDLCTRRKLLSRAVPVLLDVQKRLPTFHLQSLEPAIALARLLQLQGKHRAVVHLLEGLHESRAADAKLPEAYLLLARTLFDYFGEIDKATTIVALILKEYPACSQRESFEALLAAMGHSPAAIEALQRPKLQVDVPGGAHSYCGTKLELVP